jgi:hypothetical protein
MPLGTGPLRDPAFNLLTRMKGKDLLALARIE